MTVSFIKNSLIAKENGERIADVFVFLGRLQLKQQKIFDERFEKRLLREDFKFVESVIDIHIFQSHKSSQKAAIFFATLLQCIRFWEERIRIEIHNFFAIRIESEMNVL